MAKTVKMSINHITFRIVLDGFDLRQKATKELLSNIERSLTVASTHLALRERVTIEIRNLATFLTLDAEGVTRVRGCYDAKRTITIGAARPWEAVQHTLFHELGHMQHAILFPDSCQSWTKKEQEAYAEDAAHELEQLAA